MGKFIHHLTPTSDRRCTGTACAITVHTIFVNHQFYNPTTANFKTLTVVWVTYENLTEDQVEFESSQAKIIYEDREQFTSTPIWRHQDFDQMIVHDMKREPFYWSAPEQYLEHGAKSSGLLAFSNSYTSTPKRLLFRVSAFNQDDSDASEDLIEFIVDPAVPPSGVDWWQIHDCDTYIEESISKTRDFLRDRGLELHESSQDGLCID